LANYKKFDCLFIQTGTSVPDDPTEAVNYALARVWIVRGGNPELLPDLNLKQFEQFIQRVERKLVIVDDAQGLWHATGLWNTLRPYRCIAVNAYSSHLPKAGNPFTFSRRLLLDVLRFTKKEFEAVVSLRKQNAAKWVEPPVFYKDPGLNELLDVIFEESAGISSIFQLLLGNLELTRAKEDVSVLLKYFRDGTMARFLWESGHRGTRLLRTRSDLENICRIRGVSLVDVDNVLGVLSTGWEIPFEEEPLPNQSQGIQKWTDKELIANLGFAVRRKTKSGIVLKSPSPLHLHVLRLCLSIQSIPSLTHADIETLTLPDLVRKAVQHLPVLEGTYSTAITGLTHTREDFHRTSIASIVQSILGFGYWPHTQTPAPDSTSPLDIYIDGKLHWAIELLRDGDSKQATKHLERFTIGHYKKFNANDYLVLNFRDIRQSNTTPEASTSGYSKYYELIYHPKQEVELWHPASNNRLKTTISRKWGMWSYTPSRPYSTLSSAVRTIVKFATRR